MPWDFHGCKKLMWQEFSPFLSAEPFGKRGKILTKASGVWQKIEWAMRTKMGKWVAVWGAWCQEKSEMAEKFDGKDRAEYFDDWGR